MQMVFLHPDTQTQQALPGGVTNPVKKKKVQCNVPSSTQCSWAPFCFFSPWTVDFKKSAGTSILGHTDFSLVFSLQRDLLSSVRMGILRQHGFPDSIQQCEASSVDTDSNRKQKRLINANKGPCKTRQGWMNILCNLVLCKVHSGRNPKSFPIFREIKYLGIYGI